VITDNFDEKIFNAFETILDTKTKIEEEQHHSNHREALRLINDVYHPAIKEFTDHMREIIREEISIAINMMQKKSCDWEVVSSHLDQVDYKCKICGYQETITGTDTPRCINN
jgi:hypothetical protein